MKVIGLDLGSREVKLAVMAEGELTFTHKWHTAYFYKHFCSALEEGFGSALKLSLEAPGLAEIADADLCVSTGYGRNNVNLKGFVPINELKAHSLGAQHQTGAQDLVLLDVGGQDVKVMRVRAGQLIDMNLNDKCAASCGRFLEQMAEVLDMDLETLSGHYLDPIKLSSTCAVFCESELIGKMAEGSSHARLAAGVNQSLFQRIEPMLKGFESESLWLSGGVAMSSALENYLQQHYSTVKRLPNPSYNGAIGCCVHGLNELKKGK